MAEQLALVVRADNTDDQEILDLLPYLAGGGYVQRVASEGDEFVDETITLNLAGIDEVVDDLAASAQELDRAVRRVSRILSIEPYRVWLRAQMAGESEARWGLLLAMQRNAARTATLFKSQAILPDYVLGLTRYPWWEADYGLDGLNTDPIGNLSALDGVANLQTIAGERPARLIEMLITGETGATPSEFWFGFRSDLYGYGGDIADAWALRLGRDFLDDTSGETTNPESEAWDGYTAVTTFATEETLAPRIVITLDEVFASTAERMRGRYLVLLRARVEDPTEPEDEYTAIVRMATAYYSGTYITDRAWAEQSIVSITGPTFRFYPIGIIEFPLADLPTARALTESYLNQVAIQMSAGKAPITTETPDGPYNVVWDILRLIPLDEGFGHLVTPKSCSVDDTSRLIVIQQPDDAVIAYVEDYDRGSLESMVAPETANLGVPVGGGQLHIAAQRINGSVKADTLQVSLRYIPRWTTLRGASVPFPHTPTIDDFNRETGIGEDWSMRVYGVPPVADGGLTIQGDECVSGSTTVAGTGWYNALLVDWKFWEVYVDLVTALDADEIVEAYGLISNPGTSSTVAMYILRYENPTLLIDPPRLVLLKRKEGVTSEMWSLETTLVGGDQFGMRGQSGVIRIYVNGVLIDTVTDANPLTGSGYLGLGFSVDSTAYSLDEFGGGPRRILGEAWT